MFVCASWHSKSIIRSALRLILLLHQVVVFDQGFSFSVCLLTSRGQQWLGIMALVKVLLGPPVGWRRSFSEFKRPWCWPLKQASVMAADTAINGGHHHMRLFHPGLPNGSPKRNITSFRFYIGRSMILPYWTSSTAVSSKLRTGFFIKDDYHQGAFQAFS